MPLTSLINDITGQGGVVDNDVTEVMVVGFCVFMTSHGPSGTVT